MMINKRVGYECVREKDEEEAGGIYPKYFYYITIDGVKIGPAYKSLSCLDDVREWLSDGGLDGIEAALMEEQAKG